MKMVSWLASCRGLSLEWYPFQRRRQQTDGRPETELRIRISRPSPDSPPLRSGCELSGPCGPSQVPLVSSLRRRPVGTGCSALFVDLAWVYVKLRKSSPLSFPSSDCCFAQTFLSLSPPTHIDLLPSTAASSTPSAVAHSCHYPAEVKEVGSRSSLVRRVMVGGNSSNESWNFQVRRLQITDKSKGFIELLQQLSVCDSVSDDEFKDRFQELTSLGDDHVICVIEDESCGKIVATGSVFIEKKFLRNCGKVGHIEDVVVDSSVRGLQLGKKIMAFLTGHARSMGCYKVILDCSVENRAFYEKCGFKQKEVQMVQYFI